MGLKVPLGHQMKCVLKGLSRCTILSSVISFQKKCRAESKSMKIRKPHLDQTTNWIRHMCVCVASASPGSVAAITRTRNNTLPFF